MTRNFPLHKALAIMDIYPDATFVAEIDGEMTCLAGPHMADALLSATTITDFTMIENGN